MTLASGTRLGPYEVTGTLGAGGMGEVYRARDTRLQRDVALKVLPDLFATDPERLARFHREAQLLAALNHPHIATIHGLEEGNGSQFLVMELVEGETLAERLARGREGGPEGPPLRQTGEPIPRDRRGGSSGPPIPVDEALAIARQVADAMQAAHEKGIIHRDLKPSNIAFTVNGDVKVLDFGLAKMLEGEGLSGSTDAAQMATHSPTLSLAATQAGVILGTAAYMAPEQAKGRLTDKRSDVWAFGCVLYEMLTGKRAFDGEDVTDIIGAVVRLEPDWSALPVECPAAIRTLLKRCLEKDRRKRVADISTALFVLDEATGLGGPAEAGHYVHAGPGVLGAPKPQSGEGSRPDWRRVAMVSAASALLVGAIVGSAVWLITRPAPLRVTRIAITPPESAALTIDGNDRDLAITPDGTRIVYAGANGTQLFVRALDALEPTPLVSLTGGAQGLFTSPDGQWVGYVESNTTLKKVAITGGPPVTLLTLDGNSRGVAWAADDTLIFATSQPATGLQRVPAAGGTTTVLTRPDGARGEADHLWPEILPSGRSVLFTITAVSGGLDAGQVAVLDLATGTYKTLVRGGSHAHYVASGHLVYAAAGTLRAVAFDLDRLEASGTPVPVLPRLMTTGVGAADFGVAADGTLVYVDAPGFSGNNERTLVWVDRQGVETPLAAPPRGYLSPQLSPDGTRLALFSTDQEQDLWVWDLARATLTRLTFEPGVDNSPVWTPDGRRLVFSSRPGTTGAGNLYIRAADGTGAPERLSESSNPQFPTDVAPDGTQVVFDENAPMRGADLRLLTLPPSQGSGVAGPLSQGAVAARPPSQRVGGPGPGAQAAAEPQQNVQHEVRSLLETRFNERNGIVSPDGRWLAYESNASGQYEIYVRPFPNVGDGQWQVSTGGGQQPLWARSGRELFYLALDGALLAVSVEPRGASWNAGSPTKVLEGRYADNRTSGFRMYDVSPDGQRFLMIKQGSGQNAAPPQIVVVQNWFEELKRLVPAP